MGLQPLHHLFEPVSSAVRWEVGSVISKVSPQPPAKQMSGRKCQLCVSLRKQEGTSSAAPAAAPGIGQAGRSLSCSVPGIGGDSVGSGKNEKIRKGGLSPS